MISASLRLAGKSPVFNISLKRLCKVSCASYSLSNYIWNTSKLLPLSGDVEINPGPRPIDQNQVFCTIFSNKLTEGLSKIWRLAASTKIAMHVVIKPVMVYLSAKLVMRRIPAALSPGNVLNMALKLPKLLCYLFQFMYSQIVHLLLENHV